MANIFVLITALLALPLVASAEGQLNLCNCGNYTSPALIEKFTAETGMTVTIIKYDSNTTALAKVEAGGSRFDLVAPSANYVPIYIQKGLLAELDHSRLSNIGNIAPEWVDVAWDPKRGYTIPWQWGTTDVAVNSADYSGDVNTSNIFLDPAAGLIGKVNVVPEMNDVMVRTIFLRRRRACAEDLEVQR